MTSGRLVMSAALEERRRWLQTLRATWQIAVKRSSSQCERSSQLPAWNFSAMKCSNWCLCCCRWSALPHAAVLPNSVETNRVRAVWETSECILSWLFVSNTAWQFYIMLLRKFDYNASQLIVCMCILKTDVLRQSKKWTKHKFTRLLITFKYSDN